MSDTLVSVENVSKKFCRSLKRSLWYGLQDLGSEVIGSSKENATLRKDEFWALTDVFFELKRGETVGLIGRNGAGKTTLLRMLSGLIKPDMGRIEVRGRMQALIALGAGFNPVLTGRENIYINAAVLGIPKKEVDRRFDEIVEFSGISDFIDAPVQSYSSGMTVRLGFSVAVHMEPDILLVDEVLAVGDIPFRAKCHRKLGELKEKGIPWILVSHDMGTIRNRTDKVVFLQKGHIEFIGTPEDGIAKYVYSLSEQEHAKNGSDDDTALVDQFQADVQEVRISDVKLLDDNLQEKDYFDTGDPLNIRIDFIAHNRIENPTFGIHIYGSKDELCYTGTNTSICDYKIDYIEGAGSIYFKVDTLPLLAGIYRIRADIWDEHMSMRDKKNEAAYLHIKGGDFAVGMFYIPHTWNIVSQEDNP